MENKIAENKIDGVKCVVRNKGLILLVRHTYGHKLWTFPGGGLNKNENPDEAIKRELFEELNIQAIKFSQIGSLVNPEGKIDIIFIAEIADDKIRPDGKEIVEARLFATNHLPIISDYAKKILTMWASQ